MVQNEPLETKDFTPINKQEAAPEISRPSLSYWSDAWIRLKQNRRALGSLYTIGILVIFSTLGPVIWPLNPAAQDLTQISQPPGFDRSAVVVAPHKPWNIKTETNNRITKAQIIGTATTQSVRLVWHQVEGATSYAIFRNIMPFEKNTAPGLPLGVVFADEANGFEDLLDLSPITYYYTILALNKSEQPIKTQRVKTNVVRVVTAMEAKTNELVAPGVTPEIGGTVMLRLHPLGTDSLGRDILARLMQGAKISLFIGIVAPAIFIIFGVLYGSIAGFVGGKLDQILMRFADFVVALPFLLFMILFKILFDVGAGESGIFAMLLAMILLSWPGTARLVRGQVLQIREAGYIGASQLLGARHDWLIIRHILPNTMGVVLVTFTFAIPSAIFTEAFLSFIGMGVIPPTASWGNMCNEGIKTMLSTPHELIFPALLISITVLSFNLLGDGLRDALDARLRNAE